MDLINFPQPEDHTEAAMAELCEWGDKYEDKGVSSVMLIGLMEVYKASVAYNLLEDEEYD